MRHQLVQPNTSSEFNQSAPHFYNFSILFIVSLPSPMGSSHYAPPKLNPTAQADEIRDDLKTRGVVLSDEKGAHGDGLTVTSWRCEVLGCRGGKACVLTFHVGGWQGTAIQTSVYDMEFMTLQGCNLVFGCAWWISLEGTELEEKWYCYWKAKMAQHSRLQSKPHSHWWYVDKVLVDSVDSEIEIQEFSPQKSSVWSQCIFDFLLAHHSVHRVYTCLAA